MTPKRSCGLALRTTRAVLLDVDGVLLDSSQVEAHVWQVWSDRHGLDPDRVFAATHGRRLSEIIAAVADHLSADAEVCWLEAAFDACDIVCTPVPGAAELLHALPTDAWALVTSNRADLVRRHFIRERLPLPAVIIDGKSVPAGKPAPDGYLMAAAALDVPIEECAALEDSPAGVAAARAAGAMVVGVTSTHAPEDLAEADVVVADLTQARQVVVASLSVHR